MGEIILYLLLVLYALGAIGAAYIVITENPRSLYARAMGLAIIVFWPVLLVVAFFLGATERE